ncbi:MAG: hypothetical protein U9N34_04800, partial [Candidatus Cloacimonadota bacterium]|nr:hypothetical protein [Candidatus Cloacimonadota bacterium]
MKIEKRAKRKIESASDNCGTYKVLSEEGLIYCGFSSNIKMGLQRLINRLKDNKYRKHIKMICKVETEETQNSIKAIIRHKKN